MGRLYHPRARREGHAVPMTHVSNQSEASGRSRAFEERMSRSKMIVSIAIMMAAACVVSGCGDQGRKGSSGVDADTIGAASKSNAADADTIGAGLKSEADADTIGAGK